MLRAVRHAVLAQQRAGFFQRLRQRLVNPRVSQWRAPGAARENRRRLALRMMPHAEYDDFPGQRDSREHRARHVSRINVTRMRHKTRSNWDGWLARIGQNV